MLACVQALRREEVARAIAARLGPPVSPATVAATIAFARVWGISIALGRLSLHAVRLPARAAARLADRRLRAAAGILVAVLVQTRGVLAASDRRTHRLVLAATEYTVQTLYHGVLLFLLPAYWAATTLTSYNVIFLLLLVALTSSPLSTRGITRSSIRIRGWDTCSSSCRSSARSTSPCRWCMCRRRGAPEQRLAGYRRLDAGGLPRADGPGGSGLPSRRSSASSSRAASSTCACDPAGAAVPRQLAHRLGCGHDQRLAGAAVADPGGGAAEPGAGGAHGHLRAGRAPRLCSTCGAKTASSST